jgi:hypothetical protein
VLPETLLFPGRNLSLAAMRDEHGTTVRVE